MAIDRANLEVDEAGLWELGVALPLDNMNMARFEQQSILAQSVDKGSDTIVIRRGNAKIKPNSRLYIGPSSDPTRDNNGLLYYGEYESFKIKSITASGVNDIIVLDPLEVGSTRKKTDNAYLPGDPVVFRPLAESWEFLNDNQFDGINSIPDPRLDTNFTFSREDSLDEHRGFSQGIRLQKAIISNIDVGISQALSGSRAKVLQLLQNKVIAISSWIRVQNGEELSPFLLASFYTKPSAMNDSAIPSFTYLFNTVRDDTISWNLLISDRIRVPANPVSFRICSYATFSQNTQAKDLRFHIDDIVAEHIDGTSQESNGRYIVDINPTVGLSTSNRALGQTSKDSYGIIRRMKSGDPGLKLEISAYWQNRPGYFINDMLKLEQWNRMGYPIVLRPKMPGYLPNVLFCEMNVSVNYIIGMANERGDVQIQFREVSV